MASKVSKFPNKAKLGIIAAGVVLVAWIVGSSFFFDSFGTEEISQLELDAVQKMGTQIKGAEQTAFLAFMDEFSKDENVAEQPMPHSKGGPKLIGSGSVRFTGTAGVGSMKLFNMLPYPDQIVRFEGLKMLNGPDLHVYMTPNHNIETWSDMKKYADLGAVRGNIGDHNYNIPTELDATEFGSFVIASEKYKVVFASVNLDVHPENGGILRADASEVVGSWNVESSEDAGWASITIEKDGNYYTHLNDKPFEEGTWKLNEGTLELTSSVEDMSLTFRNSRIEQEKLVLEGAAGLTVLKK